MIKKISNKLIAVSPIEIIPEEYISSVLCESSEIKEEKQIPGDWTVLAAPESTEISDLINEIYSIPRTNYLRELEFIEPPHYYHCSPTSQFYKCIRNMLYEHSPLWFAASRDIKYPESYDSEVLCLNPWIEKGDWKLICLGLRKDRDDTILRFRETIQQDIIIDCI